MKFFKCILMIQVLMEMAYGAEVQEKIVASWLLDHLIYEEQDMQLPNPDLRLTFNFFENGTLRIHWNRGNVTEFCESFSNWKIENATEKHMLTQNTFALNPKNSADCSRDPDMKLGPKPATEIRLENDQLFIVLMLADQNLIYVFNKQ